MECQRLLIELDALLDTRLATVARLSVENAVQLASTKYRNRLSKDLTLLNPEIDMQAFNEAYSKRDHTTFMASKMTGGVFLLAGMVEELENQTHDTPFLSALEIDVNVYPYKVDEAVEIALINSVMAYAGLETKVNIVNLSPESLRPGIIKSTWAGLMMYDFDNWLNLHNVELTTSKIPTITIIAPALFKDVSPKEDDLKNDSGEVLKPFTTVEMALCEFVSVSFVDSKYFSII